MSDLRDQVRDRYAAAATAVAGGTSACCAESAESAADASCCAPEGVAVEEGFGAELYSSDERAELPAEAVLASLGCGNPLAVADLQAGEVVLDLGSGGGIDVLLSARRVGPEGKAYGLDMTEEMLALARTNAAKAGATNVEFLRGHIEEIPLPAGSVDVVILRCSPRAGPAPAGRGGADGSSHRSGIGPPGRSARGSRLCAATPGTGSTSSGPAPATGAFPWPSPAAPARSRRRRQPDPSPPAVDRTRPVPAPDARRPNGSCHRPAPPPPAPARTRPARRS